MRALFGQTVFIVADQAYCWEDVALAARLWGDWAALEQEVRQGIACLKRLDGIEDELDDEEVEAAATAFRYEHDLISAEETAAWLDRWGLTVESWMQYFQRASLRARWSGELAEVLSQYPVSDEEVEAELKCEAICSGRLLAWARQLAGRAAVFERARREAFAESLAVGAEASLIPAPPSFAPHLKADDFPGISPEAIQAKIGTLSRLERCFDLFCQRLLTPKAIKDQVSSHHLDWIRVDCLHVSFPAEQMAREAALCVREDRIELGEVAAEAHRPLRRSSFYLGQLDPALRDRLLGTAKGELVGPLHLEEEFFLFLVLDKIVPSEDDPEIRERAAQGILNGAVENEINRRVRWQRPL